MTEPTKFPPVDEWGRPRTPYAVICSCTHRVVYLTEEEYDSQMSQPDSLWKCPICGYEAEWSDDNYEEFL